VLGRDEGEGDGERVLGDCGELERERLPLSLRGARRLERGVVLGEAGLHASAGCDGGMVEAARA
jgi:hypothetical protein